MRPDELDLHLPGGRVKAAVRTAFRTAAGKAFRLEQRGDKDVSIHDDTNHRPGSDLALRVRRSWWEPVSIPVCLAHSPALCHSSRDAVLVVKSNRNGRQSKSRLTYIPRPDVADLFDRIRFGGGKEFEISAEVFLELLP
jgi:hypothetical protein